jgi:hypothetical protein
MFLKRSPIVCVRRKLRVTDTILEAAPTLPKPEWAIKKSGSALCKAQTRGTQEKFFQNEPGEKTARGDRRRANEAVSKLVESVLISS